MSGDPVAVTIQVLDKEYMVSCPPEERESLVESARYLDRRMREVRDGGKVLGSERIAVMAALNLAHELLASERERAALRNALGSDVHRLEEKIQAALGRRRREETVD